MDSYLSEELSVETNHGVLRHVAECRDCAAELKRRQRLRALLSETLDFGADADRARTRISLAVDREQRSWRRVSRLGAVAATLVVAVAVA
jgi:anti-sigma factor RsiW